MEKSFQKEGRRNFIKTAISTAGIFCLGCPSLLSANAVFEKIQEQDFLKKIQTEYNTTHEVLFRSRYVHYIQRMERFAEYMGRDNLIAMLKRATDDNNLTHNPNPDAKSVEDYATPILENENFKFRVDCEVLELTDKVWELKFTNCLWAKTFREMNAGDIGYASVCHGDFSSATVFNQKLKLERTKTLMEGHDFCNHRYT